MSLYDDAKLILTPNAYKEGVLYTLKPTPATVGNFDVVRATSATRVNEKGLIESVGNDIARLDYTNGEASVLVEPQRTNYALNSNVETLNNNAETCTPTTLLGVGALSVLNNSGGDQVASTGNAYRVTPSVSLSIVAGDYVTYSFYIRKDTADGNVIDFWLLGSTPNSVRFQPRYNFETDTILQFQSPTNIANTNLKRYKVDGDTYFVEATFEALANTTLIVSHFVPFKNDGQFTIAAPQIEIGLSSSYIPTEGTTVTRNADVNTVTPPTGTTEITEYFEDGTTNVITSIPATYTIPNGRISKIIMI